MSLVKHIDIPKAALDSVPYKKQKQYPFLQKQIFCFSAHIFRVVASHQ
jgi:hypothetical protein